MLNGNPSFWEEVKSGFFGVWNILPRAGAFGLGFLIGSAFFKPVVDVLTSIQGRRRAELEVEQLNDERCSELERLRTAARETETKLTPLTARNKELGLRRYLTGALVGLVIGASLAVAIYLRVPQPTISAPSPKYAEGFSVGYTEGYRVRSQKARKPTNENRASAKKGDQDPNKRQSQTGNTL